MKNSKKFIISGLLIAILVMAIGYSTFTTRLNINGTAQIIGEWNVKITNIEAKEISEQCDPGTMQYTNTTATFDAKLIKPGDSITYVITIQNAGTIDAKLDNISCTSNPNDSEAIEYTIIEPEKNLKAGEQTNFTITVYYKDSITEVPEIKTKTITGIIEYIQE